jgi:ClpP class serine protease
MLSRVHASFADVVWSRRGAALQQRGLLARDDACSGEVWTGAEAAANGIVDAVGDMGPVLRDTFGPVRFFEGRCYSMTFRKEIFMPVAAADSCVVLRHAGCDCAHVRRAAVAVRPAGAERGAARSSSARRRAPRVWRVWGGGAAAAATAVIAP